VKSCFGLLHIPICMAVAATDCVLHACRVKGGQELVAAIQAAKQARLKVRPRWSAAQTTCGDLGVPKPKAGSMAQILGGWGVQARAKVATQYHSACVILGPGSITQQGQLTS
jgi:hypothetical protein